MSLSVKVDEDLPAEIATLLSAAGHDAKSVYAQGHSGLPDDQLWRIVQQEQRMLFTADKGFANARDYPPGSHAGVVLFRLPRESRRDTFAWLHSLSRRCGSTVSRAPSSLFHQMRFAFYEHSKREDAMPI